MVIDKKMGTKFIFVAMIAISFIHIGLCNKFPDDFVWGVASASYQIEGAWNISGRGPSIWDTFSSTPGRVSKNHTGQIADDFYHLYREDIALMQGLGIKHFRISLSWSRLLPNGTVNLKTQEGVNQAGVQFYNDVFDALLKVGIEPWVTLYHWDLPDALFNKSYNGGWLNPDISNKFNDYAEFCFQTFGSKIKKWITFNEILTYAWVGYGIGVHAPGRCSPEFNSWCKEVGGGGNTSTEPYIVTHNSLIAHALAVQTYRTKFQKAQKGSIGITCNSNSAEPFDPKNSKDVEAVDTDIAFQLGWFFDPIFFGKYPDVMVKLVSGNRLPAFNSSMSELIKGSVDFVGLNHYTTKFVKYTGVEGNNWSNDGQFVENATDINGKLIGPYSASSWLNVYPKGMRQVLNWVKKRYNNPPTYIFENGVSCPNESSLPLKEALNDTFRVDYFRGYIANMIFAITIDNVNVKGYFAWSIIDNFEWADGYDVRFGMVYVDYNNNLTRHVKRSARWYSSLIYNLDEGKHKQKGKDFNNKIQGSNIKASIS